MTHVITLTGPSGSGKSTALRSFPLFQSATFSPILIGKLTTRPRRDEDDPSETVSVPFIPSDCDLVYEQYGDRYGLQSQKLYDHLVAGRSPLVVLNDVRTVEDLRRALGKLVRSVFIFRRAPSLEEYIGLAKGRGIEGNLEDVYRRFIKAQAIYRIYIENIHLFDHVIINDGTREELSFQIGKIVTGLSQVHNWPLLPRREKEMGI